MGVRRIGVRRSLRHTREASQFSISNPQSPISNLQSQIPPLCGGSDLRELNKPHVNSRNHESSFLAFLAATGQPLAATDAIKIPEMCSPEFCPKPFL